MSELESEYVKQGYWNEVTRGPVLGRTITTNVRTGTLVIALLAMLVALATSHLWNLVLFAIHQIRANGKLADALFRQQQVLLRAAPSPASLLAEWIKLHWVARRTAKNALPRSLFQLTLALLFTVGTIVAGVFSSYVVDSTNLHVLVRSVGCGPLDLNAMIASTQSVAYLANVWSRSTPYTQDCYRTSNAALPARCNTFIKPSTPLRPERVPCPFNETFCMQYDRPAVTIDSGLVNGNDIFGWNLRPQDEIKFRRRLTCGMLESRTHQKIVNGSDYPLLPGRRVLPGEQIILGYYSEDDGTEFPNVTFARSLLETNVSRDVYVRRNSGTMTPLPGLRSNDSDFVLAMVSMNAIRYRHPVNDPFFSAHELVMLNRSGTTALETYYSDRPLSVMGCQQQYQFCLAQRSGPDVCSALTGLPYSISQADFPHASGVQIAGVQTLVTASQIFDVQLASAKLRASDLNYGGMIPSLPDDQWVQEITYWEQIVWASLQAIVSDYAVGYGVQEPSIEPYVKRNLTSGEEELCRAQRRVKPGGFMNINVFALAFIATFAVVATLLDIVLLKFIIFLKHSRRLLAPRIDRWIQDGVLQLQRRAYEANDQGHWTRLDKEVPTTTNDEPLAELLLETRRSCCRHVCGVSNGGVPARLMPRAAMTMDSMDTLVAQKGAAAVTKIYKSDDGGSGFRNKHK
ncbi:hypothetical protein N0V90_009756 [Kalmusia sp. IMI 367209]|nr:hypothetical protein N0V90_009756 [Kalmusia sp. IMI 367209]